MREEVGALGVHRATSHLSTAGERIMACGRRAGKAGRRGGRENRVWALIAKIT